MDINNYSKIFNSFSYNNTLYGLGTAHLITGRLIMPRLLDFGYRKIDGRTSLTFLKPTFSGGSSGYNLVYRICKDIGVHIKSLDEATDAALSGTIKKTIDDETGEELFEAVGGLLGDTGTDIIYFDEASTLFMKNPPQHQAKLKNLLQKALNPYLDPTSFIRKKLARGEIETIPHQSLYLVSFFPENLDEGIVKTGFLQRSVTIAKHHNIEERLKNIYVDIDLLGQKLDDGNIVNLIESFKETGKFIKEVDEFKVSEDIKPLMKSYAEDMVSTVRGTSASLQEAAGSFVSAYQRHIPVMGWHHAVWRESDTIEVEDIKYAYTNVINPVFKDIVIWLETKSEIRKEAREEISGDMTLKTLFNDMVKRTPLDGELQGYIGLSTFKEAVKKNFMKSEATSYRWINALKTKGSVEIINQGSAKFLRFKE